MSQDVLTVGSTMRIPLLYRGEYSQWVERFTNHLEEQMDREAMINSIKNGDQPLPRVTQVSIAGTSSTEQPPLKDKSMCLVKVMVVVAYWIMEVVKACIQRLPKIGGEGDEVSNWTSNGSMEEEEVSLVDGIFEGALEALEDEEDGEVVVALGGNLLEENSLEME
uniref:Uncharacterized protein n=1 Tax=Tanacetum cinerariifolium TaxID=118510 RepID=A0A6L2JQF1_TANCI|nr:hypothetical protein [Tanacetum cinerariifolium]